MVREFGGKEYFLTVVSASRPEQVPIMQELIGDATWVVPEEDGLCYRVESKIYDQGKNVSRARNVALSAAFELGLPCVMLDDDLLDVKLYNGTNSLETINFSQGLILLAEALNKTDLKMAATTHMTNPQFLKHEISTQLAINGGCLLIKPTPLRFEESIRLSEDVDYALQHLTRYGGAIRVNDVVMRFKRRAPGGVQLYRDEKERNKSVEQLMSRWPGIVYRSGKDPNHPVIKFPRRRVRLS